MCTCSIMLQIPYMKSNAHPWRLRQVCFTLCNARCSQWNDALMFSSRVRWKQLRHSGSGWVSQHVAVSSGVSLGKTVTGLPYIDDLCWDHKTAEKATNWFQAWQVWVFINRLSVYLLYRVCLNRQTARTILRQAMDYGLPPKLQGANTICPHLHDSTVCCFVKVFQQWHFTVKIYCTVQATVSYAVCIWACWYSTPTWLNHH